MLCSLLFLKHKTPHSTHSFYGFFLCTNFDFAAIKCVYKNSQTVTLPEQMCPEIRSQAHTQARLHKAEYSSRTTTALRSYRHAFLPPPPPDNPPSTTRNGGALFLSLRCPSPSPALGVANTASTYDNDVRRAPPLTCRSHFGDASEATQEK